MKKEDLKYAKTHEWAGLNGDVATIGLSDFAVKELSDIVFIEFPEKGKKIKQGSPFGTIESVKAAFDLNSPVSGEVIEVNSTLADNPDLLKENIDEKTWLIKVKMENADELKNLMNFKEYQEFLKK